MKLFLLSAFLLLSVCFEANARCVQSSSDYCPSARVFPEPANPKQIHYIYRGESCDCPKHHDVIVEEPRIEEEISKTANYEFKAVAQPVKKQEQPEEKSVHYLFDVRIEQPLEIAAQKSSPSFGYKVKEAPKAPADEPKPNSIRYIYDTRVEEPRKPCEDQPWQGLVAQIDTMVMPHSGCSDPSHTPESCNCGCRDASHTPATCNCRKSIFNYSPNESVKRTKRDSDNNKKSSKSKHRDFKLPKMKKIDPKELAALLKGEALKQKLPPASKKLELMAGDSLRPKRRENSPCSYTFESCDPKRKTAAGCPLCYKCKCEPAGEGDDLAFSAKDIRIPYQMAGRDRILAAPAQQEFDYEPSAYTGLRTPDMYRRYIEQIISKYPEHMARRMPDLREQQRDLMNFINELAQNDKSPSGTMENEDIRYKLLDNAVELYKMYEGAIGKSPRTLSNGKFFNKRGTVLEIVEVDPNDDGSRMGVDDYGANFST